MVTYFVIAINLELKSLILCWCRR